VPAQSKFVIFMFPGLQIALWSCENGKQQKQDPF